MPTARRIYLLFVRATKVATDTGTPPFLFGIRKNMPDLVLLSTIRVPKVLPILHASLNEVKEIRTCGKGKK